MGSYYHVLPVNGGLFVPAANMSKLIADINEYFEDNENFDLRLDPTDWVKAMDTLRDNLFYIHQKEPTHGVTLMGWGMNGNSYNGYPKNSAKITDFHPLEIVNLFHEYSFDKSLGGVLTINDYDEEFIFKSGYDIELVREEQATINLNGLVLLKEFYNPNSMDQSICIMQRVPVDGSSEAYPAVTLKTNDFKEVQDFYNEYAKEVGSVSGGGVHVSSEDYSNSVSMKELRDIAGNWANFQDYLRR